VTSPLLDGPALARSLGRPEQTLRAWAAAGLITRCGRDAQGRTLFDVDEVIGVSSARQRRRGRRVEGQEVTGEDIINSG
jgi:hypothetical protein